VNAVQVGRNLLKKFDDSLNALALAPVDELRQVPGIGRDKAVTLAAAFALARRLEQERREESPVLDNPATVVSFMREENRLENVESFLALLLNVRKKLIRVEKISHGLRATNIQICNLPSSVPLAWEALGAQTHGDSFHVTDVDRWYTKTDPWADFGKTRQKLTATEIKAAQAAVERVVHVAAVRQRDTQVAPLPELRARDLRGRRVLHEVVERHAALAAQPGLQVAQPDLEVVPERGLGAGARGRSQQVLAGGLGDLKERLTAMESRTQGIGAAKAEGRDNQNDSRGMLFGILGIAIGVAALLVTIITHFK